MFFHLLGASLLFARPKATTGVKRGKDEQGVVPDLRELTVA